jgi:hypothetical protein
MALGNEIFGSILFEFHMGVEGYLKVRFMYFEGRL